MKEYFEAMLALRFPTNAGVSADFRQLFSDIQDAVDDCNALYKQWGTKELRIKEVQKNHIVIHYCVENQGIPHCVSGRDLSRFSRFLLHKRGWEKYSTVNTKLFIPAIKDISQSEYELPVVTSHSETELSDVDALGLLTRLFTDSNNLTERERLAAADIKLILASI
ncbi:hypothetical protein [Paenibacillus taichungensis]